MSNKGISLDSFQYVKVGNVLYGVSGKWNALFSVDILSDELSIISYVPERTGDMDFSNILYWNGYLILVPLLARKVWFYSIEEHIWEFCEIKDVIFNLKFGLFCASYIMNGILYMIGIDYPGIAKIELNNKEFLGCIPIYENVMACQNKVSDSFSFFSHVVVGNEMYIASGISNVVHVLDLATESYKDVKIGKETDRYVGIAYDGNTFWLAARKGTGVYRWDGKEKLSEIIRNNNDDRYYYRAIYFLENTIVVAGGGESNYYINPGTSKVIQKMENYIISQICDDGTMICKKGEETFLKYLNELIEVNTRIDVRLLKKGFEETYKIKIITLLADQVLIENEKFSLIEYVALL